MRYFFLSLDAAGNWPPERTLIRALVDGGHEVHVASDACHKSDIVAAGGVYVPYRHAAGRVISGPNVAQSSSQVESDASELEHIFKTVLLNADFGDELADAITRIEPDVLLVDMMLWSAISAADRCVKSSGFCAGANEAIPCNADQRTPAAWRSPRPAPRPACRNALAHHPRAS